MRATNEERFARLNALRRPGASAATVDDGDRSGGSVARDWRLEPLPGMSPDVPEGAELLARILGAIVRENKFGPHLGLRRWFAETIDCAPPEVYLHPDALKLLAPDLAEKIADSSQWLFLDTETTGLCGGTGTYPFLIGIAWWDVGGLEVEQFFMREHSEEHSVLVALAERMAERPVLVTFNGK